VDKRKVIIPIVAVAAAAGAWWFWKAHSADPSLIRLSGNIELTQANLSFKYPGKLVELLVDEGFDVKKGQLLARLDLNEYQRQVEREHASVASSQSSLIQLRTSIDYQKANIESDVTLKRANLQQAEARLTELLNGSRKEEIEQARASLAEAQATQKQAAADWERAQTLFKNDDISAQQHDQFRRAFDTANATVRRLSESLKLAEIGPRKEDIDQQRAVVEQARASVKLAEANRIDLKRRTEEIGMRQADIQRAQAQAGVLDSQLSDRTLFAPFDGVVLTKGTEIGEVLAAGASVVTVGDVEHPWVRAYLSEKDLGRVKLGTPATVTTDSFKGKEYHGKVTFISSEAEFTPKQIQTEEERTKLVYRIKVEVPNPNRELKSNMPADVEIRVQ
jgi:HlyD family secretion protein